MKWTRKYEKQYRKKYRKEHLEYFKEYRRIYYQEHKEKALCQMIEYQRKREKLDPKFKLGKNMRSSMWLALKGKKAGRKWEKLVGYTLDDLMKHLEKQFDDKMTWKNYGSYWHIDHIRPKALFNYTSPNDSEFKQCWALKNLQPLEKIANIKKGKKVAQN